MTQRLVALAALVGLGLASAVYVSASKSVVLVIDGKTEQVSTMHETVGSFLDHQGIALSSYDVVEPKVQSRLRDGTVVRIDYARQVYLTVDGKESTTWTTARDVGSALRLAGINANAWVSQAPETPIDRSGISLDVRLPKKVTLSLGKSPRIVISTAKNVDQLLQENKITLGTLDRSIPSLTTTVSSGMKIRVVRVYQKTVTKIEVVKHNSQKIADKTMLEGLTKVKVKGSDGRSRITYQLVYADGRLESKKAVKTVVLSAPTTGVVVYGVKKRTLEQLNWAALARCESHGRPTAVSRNRLYYGLFQFSLTAWKSVGGSGKPSEASAEEQLMRAKLLYQKRGKSPWPHCGRHLWS